MFTFSGKNKSLFHNRHYSIKESNKNYLIKFLNIMNTFFADGGAGAGDAGLGERSSSAESKTLFNIYSLRLHG